jgi:excisionase family DNA binding protein
MPSPALGPRVAVLAQTSRPLDRAGKSQASAQIYLTCTAAVGPAGAGLDGAGGAERPSTRAHGRAAPGNANRSRPAPVTPAEGPGTADDPLLTIDEVIAELRVSRTAFYRWRRQGAGPAVVRLPGGGVRVRRSALTAWLRRLEEEDT